MQPHHARSFTATDTPTTVVLDVDGTLLSSRGRLSERNRRAVELTGLAGVDVVLATGKSPASIIPLHRQLGLRTDMVCSQGTVLCDADGEIIESITLDPAHARSAVEVAVGLGLVPCAYAGRELFAEVDTAPIRALSERYHEPTVQRASLLDLADAGRINKLILTSSGGIDHGVRARLDDRLARIVTVTQAVAESLEVIPAGVDKASGVRLALERCGRSYDEVLAIGDGENDIGMVRAARIGVAVGNGVAALRAAADHVVASNDDDGVAAALEHHVLARR